MLTYPETQAVPLTTTENDVIRITGTRIGLDVDWQYPVRWIP